MAPFRLPFTSKKPAPVNAAQLSDENTNPANTSNPYNGDKPSLALGIKEKKQEPNEFKLSSVNGSGEYLPPSPNEQRSFWGKSSSTASTKYSSTLSEQEPFSISRESFDSYRRSFDISGRSPIIHADSYTSRTSLDSRRLPRASLTGTTFERPLPAPVEDAAFEEVGLHDEVAKPKKKSFFSRFGDSSNTDGNTNTTEDGKSHHFSLMPGRKRGQSGTGSELGSMDNSSHRPDSKGKPELTVR